MILVAIPYHGVPGPLIDKAVKHALAQTLECVVLVAGDGQPPPVSVRHDRLVVGTFERNCGTPMTQQAMIAGSPFEWYAPWGADDFAERGHLASLAATHWQAAGSSSVWYHEGAKAKVLRSPRTWIEFGLFGTDVLRWIGGYAANEPFGQDSVVISILLSTIGVRLTRKPTYHKVYRPDSLTHAPGTRQGSVLREAVKARNRDVLQNCAAIGWQNVDAIRTYRESLLPPAVRTELEDRAALVAKWLA